MPFSVACSARPSRSMYSRLTSRSMIDARVAGVPMPESFIASRSSASSISLPAVSIAPSSEASVKRRGGWVSLRIDSTDSVCTVSPCSSLGSSWSPPESSSPRRLVGLLAVDALPAGLEQPAAAGAEDVLGDGGLDARALVDGLGVEDRQEALGDEVVDLQLVLRPCGRGRARSAWG